MRHCLHVAFQGSRPPVPVSDSEGADPVPSEALYELYPGGHITSIIELRCDESPTTSRDISDGVM